MFPLSRLIPRLLSRLRGPGLLVAFTASHLAVLSPADGQDGSGANPASAREPARPAAASNAPFPHSDSTELALHITALLAEPEARRAHWGITVAALDGTPLYGADEGKLFRPASNTKLFTTAAAMQYLGNTSVETRVAGGVDLAHLDPQGVLQGDLLLAGRGDANLSARTLPYVSAAERRLKEQQRRKQGLGPEVPPDPLLKINGLASELARHGLKHVTGNVVGDDTLWPWEPYAADWTLDDATDGDGPPVSALSVIDNVLAVRVTPGAKPGDPAEVSLFPVLRPCRQRCNGEEPG